MTFSSANLINFDFVKWELALLAFAVLIAVFIWRGKGIKSAIIFLLVAIALIGVALFTKYIIVLAIDEPSEAVRVGVAWVPTVDFALVIFFSTLLGVTRGFRKSAILMVQSLCAAAVCIGLYFFCINSEAVDELALKAANLFTGDFAGTLGVSAECSTMREVLSEYIPGILGGFGTEVNIILRDNGAYIATIVDAAYQIAFAILCYIVYLFLVFVLYIVYHCAYSERKYKQRKDALMAANKTDSSYRKHSAAGGVLGFVRGLAAGLISLSFLGSLLFIAAGGTGDGTLEEYSFGDDNYDFGYSVFRSVEDYGNHGIFKLLNKFKSTDDSPYYLFAADLIFSGGLEDQKAGINANIKLRKELGAYSGFARQTLSLLLKHGEDEIKSVLMGTYNGDKTDAILKVMCRPEFQAEFETLIDGFEAQTYIINFALSAINSIISEIDNTSFANSIGETNREMLKLLFKPGYLSPYIPDEASGSTGKNQPVLNFTNVFRRSDAKTVYKLVVSILTSETNTESDMGTLEMVNELMPHLERLSMLSPARESEFNPVFTRLYCFLANVYLSTEDGGNEVEYAALKNENVKWVSEINSLLTVWGDGYGLIKSATEGEGSAFEHLLSLFDKEKPDYELNITRYDNCCEALAKSKLFGKVLVTDYMQEQFIYELFRAVNENIYIPSGMTYENTYDTSGNLIKHGEIYNLLLGVRLMGTEKEYRKLIINAIGGNSEDDGSSHNSEFSEIIDLISGFGEIKEGYNKPLSYYFTESSLLRSLVSNLMLELEAESLIVPYSVCESGTDGRMIEKEVLADLFEQLCDPELREALKTLEDADMKELLENEAFKKVLKGGNGIIEGSIAHAVLSETANNEYVVIPSWLKIPEGGGARDIPDNWLTDKRGSAGEVGKIANALDYIDISALLGDSADLTDQILDRDWTDDELETLFASDVLHFSASKNILSDNFDIGGGFTVIVPKDACTYLSGEDIGRVVNVSELVTVLGNISEMNINSESSASDILRELNAHKNVLESYIICASMAHFIAGEQFLDLPAVYERAAQKEELEERGGAYSWQKELTRLLDAIDALFDLDGEEEINFDDEGLLERKLNERLADFNSEFENSGKTRLEYCCASEIVLHNITDKIDRAIEEWAIKRTDDPDRLLFENEESLQKAKRYNGFCASWYYTHDELEPLVNAVKVFDLKDFFGTNAEAGGTKEDISAKVEQHLLALNESKLDAIYGSYIIRKVVTNEVDGVFTSERIVIETRDSLKDEFDLTYLKQEMSGAVTAVSKLTEGVEGNSVADKVGKLNFDSMQFLSDNLDDLYASKLVAACITKSVQDVIKTHGTLAHHDKAYMDGYAIYKESEISALIDVAGTDGTAANFGIDDLDKINDKVGKSYLVDASLTVNILRKEDLFVPMSAVTEYGVIESNEITALLNAFTLIAPNGNLSGWSGISSLPDKTHHAKISRSAILRATVAKKTNGEHLYVSKQNAIKCERAALQNGIAAPSENGDFVVVPTAGQAEAMLGVLPAGDSFAMPSLNGVSDLPEDIEPYIACDMLKFRICELLYAAQDIGFISGYEFRNESVWDIASGEETEARSLSDDDIRRAVAQLRNAPLKERIVHIL
ncbi:MAG: hypothetical protein HFE36_07245 [Clostridia bacterium]|nr:hypothetical protein [Clostridia bacterium]